LANSSTKKRVVERCWTLVGRRQGRLWHARRMKPISGQPASVAFDADWALAREESKGDIVGFYHTHPSGMPSPSKRDDRTMWAWVASFGKPLLCLIESNRVVHAFLYKDDESAAVRLAECERFPRGIIVAYDNDDAYGNDVDGENDGE